MSLWIGADPAWLGGDPGCDDGIEEMVNEAVAGVSALPQWMQPQPQPQVDGAAAVLDMVPQWMQPQPL